MNIFACWFDLLWTLLWRLILSNHHKDKNMTACCASSDDWKLLAKSLCNISLKFMVWVSSTQAKQILGVLWKKKKKKRRLDLYGDNVFGSLSLSKGSISTHRFMTHPYTLNDGFRKFYLFTNISVCRFDKILFSKDFTFIVVVFSSQFLDCCFLSFRCYYSF